MITGKVMDLEVHSNIHFELDWERWASALIALDCSKTLLCSLLCSQITLFTDS